MALTRNFRTTYYKTLGVPVVPHIVDLEASYAALLHEPVLNLPQLIKLGLEVGVSPTHRAVVWKVLCGVVPAFPAVWATADLERAEMFEDLADAARVLLVSTTAAPASPSAAATSDTTHELLQLHRLYWLEVMAKPPLRGMSDARYLHGIARVVQCAVPTSPVEQFWCLTAILQVLGQAVELMEPSVAFHAFYDISVPEFEMYFLRALECVRAATRS